MSLAPNPENYLLGRGRVYFDQEDQNGDPTGFLDLGNTPAFTAAISADTLDHFSSRSGLKTRDARVITAMNVTFGLTLDEFSKENLKLAFMGTTDVEEQTSGTWTDEDDVYAKLDRWIDLGKRGIEISSLAKKGGGALSLTTDYLLDAIRGWVFIKSENTASVEDDDEIEFSGTYAELTIPKLIAATQQEGITGHLVFVGDPAEGQAYEFHAWRVNIKPSGEIGLISEDWASFQLEGECLKDSIGHPEEPFFVVYELS